ncbi:MAG: hypothetical protein H5T69_10405 [Chloroflexi bacterium]|nr:hypothetical protein [Chloroflexota bacterium]
MLSRERLLATFLDLVQIPSPSGQEHDVAQTIVGRLQTLKLPIRQDEAGN